MRLSLFVFLLSFSLVAFSENRTVNLTVAYKTVYFAGKNVQAIAVNHQIPAPTLHFKEGDHVVINVTNHLKSGTIIHWHGLLVPWQMDGVENVSQRNIQPGKTFRYHFTLRQSGTYWYHAHAGFQEQQGLYGALIIAPKKPRYQVNADFPIVLSDWSNTNPESIYANLKRSGDYYDPRFPIQATLSKFIHDYRKANPEKRKALWKEYVSMQKMRMDIYDFSDVAYDAFLLNGKNNHHPWIKKVKAGGVVRLRFIDAGASTNFNIKIPGYTLKIIQVDGNDVKPIKKRHIFITPGETYDVLIKIRNKNPAIIYAESSDTIGAAFGALITSSHEAVNFKSVKPFPEPISSVAEMEANMPGNHAMSSMSHNMSMHETVSSVKTSGTKYQHLVALVKTNNPNKPILKTIHIRLSGYMNRYIWMINGSPEYNAKPIIIKAGERYRFIFTNQTMMHHPMHLHGHWFILRNGHGAYDPLLHTIDVAPGATVVADVDADASGQWIFHCHQLYHMFGGMTRIIQYQSIINIANGIKKAGRFVGKTNYHNRPIVRVDNDAPIIPALIQHPMMHQEMFFMSNALDIGNDVTKNLQEITFTGKYGSDYNKLKLSTDNAEIENGSLTDFNLDVFYWRLISEFWAVEAGVNYFDQPARKSYWQPGAGIVGVMPFFIDTNARVYYHDNSVKFDIDLSRDTQITNNFFIRAGVESIFATKTVDSALISSGLNQMQYTLRPYYRITPGFSVFTQYQHTKNYGLLTGEENTYTLGLACLF